MTSSFPVTIRKHRSRSRIEPPPVRTDTNLKVAIVFSETSAAKYFSETAYSQLIMAAQSQAIAAGVPFDILTESDLTNLSTVVNYDAIIFPSFANVKQGQAERHRRCPDGCRLQIRHQPRCRRQLHDERRDRSRASRQFLCAHGIPAGRRSVSAAAMSIRVTVTASGGAERRCDRLRRRRADPHLLGRTTRRRSAPPISTA